MAKKEKRFEVVYTEDTFATTTKVLVDRTTGVNYLFHESGNSGGLTVLLDREGKPVISTISSFEE